MAKVCAQSTGYRLRLVHIWLAMSQRGPSTARSSTIVRPPCEGRRRSFDFRTDYRAPKPRQFCLVRTYHKLEKLEARNHVVGASCRGAR